MDNTLAAAKAIAAARRNHTPLHSLGPEIAPRDEAEGYRIQRAVHDLLLPYLGAMVGYKIGCTSAVMQQYLDIPHPCGGGVFAKGVHDSGAALRAGDFVRVGVECEIAVKLARDLPASEAPFTAEWVAEAIEAYYPAIEIVDDRYVQWETMGAPTLVADDFFAAISRLEWRRSSQSMLVPAAILVCARKPTCISPRSFLVLSRSLVTECARRILSGDPQVVA
jgi:2-keto-4-pentenoate hydratase